MEIKKLMIGDWAIIRDYPIMPQKGKVKQEHFVRSLVNFEPIQLTEEFFEKNSIKKVDYDYLKPNVLFESENKRIQVTDLANSGEGYWNVHIDNEDYETIGGCDVKYVHQFQQLLRLCGYEMDVVV